MASSAAPPDPPRDPRLEDRVVELLSVRPGAIAFNGLRRTLGAHPESLTRALRRLERFGLVEHADGGYRLGPAAQDETPPRAASSNPPTSHRTVVGEVQMVAGLDSPQVLGLLAGRWAGELRWVGVYDRPGQPLLVWSRTNGPGHVLLGLDRGQLRVYAETSEPGPPSSELAEAARSLLVFALGRLRGATTAPDGAADLLTFELTRPRVDFGPN